MSLTSRLTFTVRACLPLVVVTLLPLSDARAAVSQPSGESMPQPPNKAELDVICSRGFPDGRTGAQRMGSCGNLPASTPDQSADSLLGLFSYNQEGGMLDPVRDAYTTPGTFSPQCGLTGTIVLRGGVCQNTLAWYNAVENPTAPPAMNELYTLVPGDLRLPPPMGLGCDDNDFCPLATRMHNQAPTQHRWADPLPEFAGNIRTDPRWKGGLIGFALVPPMMNGQPQGQCPQIHYSQKELNPKSTAAGTAGMPWVMALVYQSKIDPGAYYLAFEDQPACPASWQGGNCGGVGVNDGDFNDFVFYVKGLTCKGGGQPCTIAGAKGICAQGATQCAAGGTMTTCVPVVQPSPEMCDGVDNDCNDVVDEGDGLCPPMEVCSQGVCRHFCDDSEFPCAVGLTCDTSDRLCKDRGCIGKTCAAGQVCQLGTCVGGCDGVMCPQGQVCRLGNCVSPCTGISCPADRPVCEGGACQPLCSDKCRSCDTGFSCDMRAGSATLGYCLVTGCENKTCPAGQVCVGGNCQDGCQGVTCPGGQECMMGKCTLVAMPDAGVPAGSGGQGGFVILGNGGQGGSGGARGGAGGATTSGAAGNGSAGTTPPRPPISTCGCDTTGGPGGGVVALVFAGIAVAVGRRRRAVARARK